MKYAYIYNGEKFHESKEIENLTKLVSILQKKGFKNIEENKIYYYQKF